MGYLLQQRKTTRIIPRKPSPCRAKPISSILNSESWEGRRCFILCGGPSLEGFDFSQIREEHSIGINKSFLYFPTTINYSMDARFYDALTFPNRNDSESNRIHNLWKGYSGRKVVLKYDRKAKLDESVFYVNSLKKPVISLDVQYGIYAGNNSGFGGMMLAIALGCKEIYLLGVDLKIDEKKKKTHFHEGYRKQNIKNLIKALERFKMEFERFAGNIEKLGIKVINCNLNSALNCFSKKDIKGIL